MTRRSSSLHVYSDHLRPSFNSLEAFYRADEGRRNAPGEGDGRTAGIFHDGHWPELSQHRICVAYSDNTGELYAHVINPLAGLDLAALTAGTDNTVELAPVLVLARAERWETIRAALGPGLAAHQRAKHNVEWMLERLRETEALLDEMRLQTEH